MSGFDRVAERLRLTRELCGREDICGPGAPAYIDRIVEPVLDVLEAEARRRAEGQQ